MDTNIVTIDLGLRSYDIYIGSGLLYRFADFVPVDLEGRKFFIVTDTNVQSYAGTIKNIILDAKAQSADVLTLPAGEKTKSFNTVETITNWLLDKGVGRDSVIVAVGGGVIGDVTGFCASVTMRGVPYVQVPTTLLSQVDSSVGGKTGINTEKGKNLIGSFYQPGAVVIDLDTLKTLPRREMLAGYAEVVKYGLINDLSFFTWLERNGRDVCAVDEAAVSRAIEVSTQAKAAVVEVDEHEEGQRALLNLGHTFGHALEAVAGYDGRLLHGEAVAIGMVMAFDLSVRMGICSRNDLERVENHLIEIGLPTRASSIRPSLNTSVEELMTLMRRDKKVEKGRMKFILVNGIGEAFIESDVPENLVRGVLKDSLGAEAIGTKSGEDNVKKSFRESRVKGLWKSVFSSHS